MANAGVFRKIGAKTRGAPRDITAKRNPASLSMRSIKSSNASAPTGIARGGGLRPPADPVPASDVHPATWRGLAQGGDVTAAPVAYKASASRR